MALEFHKVASLPGTLVADAIYFVENGTYTEAYVVDNSQVAKAMGNSVMINALIDAKLAAFNQGIVDDVADITARDALTLDENALVLVYDASDDATVTAGSALYYYDFSLTSWTKVTEFESLDLTLTWSSLTDGPSSTPAQVDAAVAQSHSHSNKTFLDKIGESGGDLTYGGSLVSGNVDWTTNNW